MGRKGYEDTITCTRHSVQANARHYPTTVSKLQAQYKHNSTRREGWGRRGRGGGVNDKGVHTHNVLLMTCIYIQVHASVSSN